MLESGELGEFTISPEEWKTIEQICCILEVSLFIYLFV